MKTRRWAVGAMAVGLVLAACESQSPVAVDDQEAITPAFAHIPGPPFALTLADQGRLWVCKIGPVGTYTFAASGATSLVTINGPNPFTLSTTSPTAAACTNKATSAGSGTTAFQQVTITETAVPANTAFNAVDVFYYLPVDAGAGNVMTLVYHNRFFNPAFVVNANPPGGLGNGFHADLGVLLVYRNIPISGCTLTPGYWKTHNASFPGGAPADPTWNLITPSAEQTTFFLSGDTWFGVFWTAPGGNAYYQLAHHYMAARLNQLRPASVPTAVQTALNTATSLFNTYTPAQIGALKGSDTLRQQFISLALTLANYNEGITGPGHCDGD